MINWMTVQNFDLTLICQS